MNFDAFCVRAICSNGPHFKWIRFIKFFWLKFYFDVFLYGIVYPFTFCWLSHSFLIFNGFGHFQVIFVGWWGQPQFSFQIGYLHSVKGELLAFGNHISYGNQFNELRGIALVKWLIYIMRRACARTCSVYSIFQSERISVALERKRFRWNSMTTIIMLL